MSTRSSINLKLKNGNFRCVYCHWDGYLEGVGLTLLENYNTTDKINKLMDYGDIRSLNKTIETSDFFKDGNGDDINFDSEILEFDDIKQEEYNYLFVDNYWHYFEFEENNQIRLLIKLKI